MKKINSNTILANIKNTFSKIWSFIKRIRWLTVFLVLFWTGAAATLSVVGYFAYNVLQDTESFDVTRLYSSEASQILDSQGEVIYRYGDDENGDRENATYDELPQVLIDAIVATEDSRFFEHNGFDIPRIARAAITQVLSGFTSGGGGSTITQQVIKKSYFPAAEQTITRKVSELFLAINATDEVSKEEILTMYLNKIYFGRSLSSIGIKAASNYYFNKDVQDLTLPEAALLAGTLNAPHSYDPYYNLELATQRRDIVLTLMETHGYITTDEKELAQAVKIENTLDKSYKSSYDNPVAAYVDVVTSEVIEKTGLDPRTNPMIIHTYLDSEIQADVVEYVNETYSFPNTDMQIGGSIESTTDGRIVAIIGGRDYGAFNLNRATLKQQPGSSLKPIIDYGAAYEFLDWSTAHTVTDEEYNVAGYNPGNWDGSSGTKGDMSITEAILNSWNTPAVWTFDAVMKEIGLSGYTNYLDGFKIDMTGEEVNISYAIGGWSYGLSPIELASMYATVSNGGIAIESHTVDYIEVLNGNKIIEIDAVIQEEASRALSNEAAFMINKTMESYSTMSSSYSAYPSSFRAKSGTTNWAAGNSYGISAGSAKDSLAVAYNPDYSIGIWIGYDPSSLSETPRSMTGSGVTAIRFTSGIAKLLVKDGVENSFPSTPSGMTQGSVVKGFYPYLKPGAQTPDDMILSGWFKPGTYPSATIDDIEAPALSSFEASITEDNQIFVSFAPYDPIEALEDDSVSDFTKMFGKPSYVVEVRDASTNELLYTTRLSTDTSIIPYEISTQVNIIGYYGFEKSTSVISNSISVFLGENFEPTPNLNEISANITIDGNEFISGQEVIKGSVINVTVDSQSDDSNITIVLYNEDTQEIMQVFSSESATITVSQTGTYSIRITESNSMGNAPLKIITVIVKDEFTTEEDEDEDDDENENENSVPE